MKVTKVDSARVAVISKKLNKSRVVLYATTAGKNYNGDVERVVNKRVENANRLYSVFFRGDRNTLRLPNGIEDKFTWLMSSMECQFRNTILRGYKSENTAEINRCIDNQIKWLMGINRIEELIWDFKQKKYVVKGKNRAEFSELKSPNLTDEMIDDAIVRMRKPLKRGTNALVVKRLIKALAQGDRGHYVNALQDLNCNEGKALRKYIDSVNKDYYKMNVLKSLLRHDVKVQVQENSVLNLASAENEKGNKKALTKILEMYASSEDAAAETLLKMKKIFFEYFFAASDEIGGDYFSADNLWKVPCEKANNPLFAGYFDEGFCPLEGYEEAEAKFKGCTIEDLSREDRINFGKLKARIRFVNYGKYLQMLACADEEDENAKYWIQYAKEYVERNYETKEHKGIEDFRRVPMFKACWKEAVRYLCGKYIDLGKAVYHFAMPGELSAKVSGGNTYGVLSSDYQDGVSSFAYEAIKAEETLQRNVANATVAALAAFSRSVLDYVKQNEVRKEDILFMKDEDLEALKREDVLKQILRYYGGQSEVKVSDLNAEALMQEIIDHFALIRNENFHYTAGKIKKIGYENSFKLWENDVRAYAQVIRHKYYSNNAAMFYEEQDIEKLVSALYKQWKVNAAQLPAFRTIWKRNELPAFIKEQIEKECECEWLSKEENRTKFEGALYFILKEIYYNDFVHDEKALKLFVDAVEEYKGTKGIEKSREAAENFKKYVRKLIAQSLSFAQICQAINREYNLQNANVQKGDKAEKEAYSHFKMLLPLCLQKAFRLYLKEKYSFLYKPCFHANVSGEPEYLDNVAIDCGISICGTIDTEDERRRLAWYTFAHFMHPRQLNLLIGDFKSYIQYREDVLRRAIYAQEYSGDESAKEKETLIVKASVERAKGILDVLEFVRPIAGRVSNVFEDYYENPDEYARYLGNYIDFAPGEDATFAKLVDFCRNTLPNGEVIDIYADEKNPKVLRNVEIARMYAGGDVVLSGLEKVDAKKICEYYATKGAVAALLSKGLCATEKQQRQVIKQQQLKGQLTLNDVTETFSLVNDMLGQLVSLAYLRERDKMYLLLGYYYMALRNADAWTEEVLDCLEYSNIKVNSGLVLYQVLGMFDYGAPFLYLSSKEAKWKEEAGMSVGMKEQRFARMHGKSMACAMQLFENDKYADEIRCLRNYVDHFKYYVLFDRSIVDLYTEFYTKLFGYSTKLRKSVLINFSNVLEKYFLENEVDFEHTENGTEINPIEALRSQKFTYKLKEKEKNGKNKTCQVYAKSANFVNSIKKVLEYEC